MLTDQQEVNNLNTRLVRGLFIRLTSLLLCTPAGIFIICSVQAAPKVEERADPTLPDIAALQMEPGQAPVILYNPFLCKHAGRALCQFYRYHEYGHLELRHHERNGLSIQEKEREADRWAAAHAPLHVVMAAYRFFRNGGGSSPYHGEGRSRAARLLGQANKVSLLSRPAGGHRIVDRIAWAY